MESKNILQVNRGMILNALEKETCKVLENISDVSTDSNKKRKIIIEITLVPNTDRDLIEMSTLIKSKLEPPGSIKNTLFNGVVTDEETGEVCRVLKEYSDVPEGQLCIDGTEVVKEVIAAFKIKENENESNDITTDGR